MATRFNKTILNASLVFITLLALHYLLKPELVIQSNYSQVVYDEQGRLLRITLAADDKYRLYLPLHQISSELIDTTLLYEDKYFQYHPGFNPVSLAKAFWTTYISGNRRVGASTITMQLARMRFDLDTRSIIGKLGQLLRALQLEWYFSKEQILEAYLNSVPYGGNIEGVAAASLIYFDKHPSQLNLHEALTLSVVPQNPQQRRPDRMPDKNLAHSDQAQPQQLQLAREQLLQRWLEEHPEDKAQQALLTLPPQVRSRTELPFSAPHLVNRLLQLHPQTHELKATLNSEQQNLLERNARAYIESQQNRGLHNAAALLINHRDMRVKAYLGSVDFNNVAIQGQVDGTAAKRSPGSALKPFIYALGIDQGLIHPLSMLKDAPTSFGEYNPENFDQEFSGPVSVRDALIKSRNLPAVQIANELQKPDLYDFLKQAHVALPESRQHYGLSLVLGGAEVTMQELVSLYALLPNKGHYHSLRLLQDEPLSNAEPLLSADASFMLLDILAYNPRPAQSFNSLWLKDDKPVYWKTGTSYAYRDAWSVAVFDDYVLAVWVGNFDGRSNNAFVGRDAAAPLLFRLIDAIRSQATHQPLYKLIPSDKVQHVKLCAVSGQIPSKACKHQVSSWFIPGVSPIQPCDIHREILIDKHSGLRACRNEADKVRSEVYEFWSSDLLKIFKQAGIPRRVPPSYLPACGINQTAESGIAPSITSPRLNLSYQLRHGKQQEKIPFIATTDADVQQLYWFLDETFIGKAPRGKPLFWQPKPGSYVVRVIDDLGRGSSRQLKVELAN